MMVKGIAFKANGEKEFVYEEDPSVEEIEKAEAERKEREKQEMTRPLTDGEVFRLFAMQNINALSLDPNTAIRCTSYHPEWADLCKTGYKAEKKGYRFQHRGQLYETVQPEFTFQEQWEPGVEGFAAIYSRVEWQHEGTMEDPIPVPDSVGTESFTYVVGKIYEEDGVLYKCQYSNEPEGTEHSFPYKPSQVPAYFTKIE